MRGRAGDRDEKYFQISGQFQQSERINVVEFKYQIIGTPDKY